MPAHAIREEVENVRRQAGNLAGTIREPLLILDEKLEIIICNSAFRERFSIENDFPESTGIFDIKKGVFDLPELKTALQKVVLGSEVLKNIKISLNLKGVQENFSLNFSLLNLGAQAEQQILISFKAGDPSEEKESQDEILRRGIQDILVHAPAAMCILRGPNHRFEVANEKYFQLVEHRNILGQPVREALPEVENQGFIKILDEVYQSGKAHIGEEIPIKLKCEDGSFKSSFLDFVYQPTFDQNREVNGIFAHAVDETEKVLARKEIEENEARLENLIDTVPAIIWIGDEKGQSTYLNKNWYLFTGQTEQEAMGSGWFETVHPDDRERTRKVMEKAKAAHEPFMVTFRIRNRRGNYKWVINRAHPNFNIRGKYEGMIGTVVDVHEEKVQEQLIREKEHRIRSIVEEATVATAVYIGKDMRIELANDAMIKVWGKDRSVIGKNLHDAIPELENQPYHKLLEKVYTTGETYWGKEDEVTLNINGKLQTDYFNFTYKPLRDEKGAIYGILNMAINVTQMVESKNLLAASESYFRQMADLMPDKITNSDPDGNTIYFNQNWIDYTGLTSENLKEHGWFRFIHPEERKIFEEKWKYSLESGEKFEMELRFLNKKGKYKWHLSRAEAVKSQNDQIKMWIGTNTEIQKIKEEEKRKEEFLKMVSHELKTPITSIKGYVQLLLSLLKKVEEKDNLPIKPSLERIDHQINRLTRLISEMLDLSRIEENQLELKKEKFRLNDLVLETVQDINYTNTKHEIEIKNDLQCDIYADKDRIGQVLINFIINAIKYSPDYKKIFVKTERAGERKVMVTVRDEGIGIDKKNQGKIFKRFYRIGGESEETYSGFGIGLFLAKEIIDRHNGQISVKSEIGKGSEFSFILETAK